MPSILASSLALLFSAASSASVVPADVSNIVSGGYWTSGDQSGTYRVVVTSGGFEHVTSRAFVEWIADPKSEQDEPKVVAVVEPDLPFGEALARFDATLEPIAPGKARIVLFGVISVAPDQKVRAVLIATSPGHVTSSVADNSFRPPPVFFRGQRHIRYDLNLKGASSHGAASDCRYFCHRPCRHPLPDLILGMRISAGTKNPYHIYFPKTDFAGHSSLSADDIAGQFKDHWEEGLMDYNGTLESAAQEVRLLLLDVPKIRSDQRAFMAWPLLTYEKTIWVSRQEKLDYFLSCANERYSLKDFSVVIPSKGKLQVQISLK